MTTDEVQERIRYSNGCPVAVTWCVVSFMLYTDVYWRLFFNQLQFSCSILIGNGDGLMPTFSCSVLTDNGDGMIPIYFGHIVPKIKIGGPNTTAQGYYHHDMTWYDSVYSTCSKKLTGSQLSLPHGMNKKYNVKLKIKWWAWTVRSSPVPLSWDSPVGKRNLRWERFVEKVGFEPGVKEWWKWRSDGWREWGWWQMSWEVDEVVNRDENGEGTALLVPHVRSTVDLRKPYFSASLAVPLDNHHQHTRCSVENRSHPCAKFKSVHWEFPWRCIPNTDTDRQTAANLISPHYHGGDNYGHCQWWEQWWVIDSLCSPGPIVRASVGITDEALAL